MRRLLAALVCTSGCVEADLLDEDELRDLLRGAIVQGDECAIAAGTIESAASSHAALLSTHPLAVPDDDGWWTFGGRRQRYSDADGQVQREPDDDTDRVEIEQTASFFGTDAWTDEVTVTGLLGTVRNVVCLGSGNLLASTGITFDEVEQRWSATVVVDAAGCSGSIEASAKKRLTAPGATDTIEGEAEATISDADLAWAIVEGDDRAPQDPLTSDCADAR